MATARIEEFRGAYRFLSNFYPVLIHMDRDGISFAPEYYRTVEHAYQAAKSLKRSIRRRIMDAETPGDAKKLGKPPEKGGIVVLRPNWEKIKLQLMYDLVKQKFSYQDLSERLLDTGDAVLIEGNTRNDKYWGVAWGEGKNHLGRILMLIRGQLQDGTLHQKQLAKSKRRSVQ